MKIKKEIKVVVCSVAVISTLTVGISANSKLKENEKIIATLENKVEVKDNSIRELEERTKLLQEEVKKVNKEIGTVKKEIKEIKN